MTILSIIFILFSINSNKITVSSACYQPRILGGFDCDITVYPFLVSVISKSVCGGTLISLEWVLTVAHCIAPKAIGKAQLRARTGFNFINKKLIEYRDAKKTILHEKYNEDLRNSLKEIRYDIGLILLKTPFSPSLVAKPIKLPTIGFTKTCKSARAIGVGKVYSCEEIDVETAITRSLKCVDINIINKTECSQDMPSGSIDDSLICTKEDEKDTCVGDSGGPILCQNNIIIGIISYGSEKCGVGRASIHTKIESYLDFITTNTNQEVKLEKTTTNIHIVIDPREQPKPTSATSTNGTTNGSWNVYGSFVKWLLLKTLFIIILMYVMS